MREKDWTGLVVLQELSQKELTPPILVGSHVATDSSKHGGLGTHARKCSNRRPQNSLIRSALHWVRPAVGGPSPRAFPEAERPSHGRFVLDEEALEHGLHTNRQDHSELQGRKTAPRTRSLAPLEILEPSSRLPFPDLRQVSGLREKTIEVYRLLPPAVAIFRIPGRDKIPRNDSDVEGASFEDPCHQLIERLARSAHRGVTRVHCHDMPLRNRHDRIERKKPQLCPETILPDPLQGTRSADGGRRKATLDEKGDP